MLWTNILLFLLIIVGLVLVHELGHFWVARLVGIKVEEFGVGYPPRLAAKRFRGVLYSLNLLPFGGFVRLKGEFANTADPEAFNNAPVGKRVAVVIAGVVMNFLLAFVLLAGAFMVGFTPFTHDATVYPGAVVSRQSVLVVGVMANSPAATLGLTTEDTVLTIDNQPVTAVEQLQHYTQERRGQTVSLTWRHEGAAQEGAVVLADDEAPLGVAIADDQVVRLPFVSALRAAGRDIWELSRLIVQTVGGLVKGLFTPAPVSPDIMGPVGIYQITARAAAAGGASLLSLVILLSINFALVNILPFPALDGGRLAFLILEGVFRRRLVKEQVEAAVTAVGFILLLMLIILLTYRDVTKLLS